MIKPEADAYTCKPTDTVAQIREQVARVKQSRPDNWQVYVKNEDILLDHIDTLTAERDAAIEQAEYWENRYEIARPSHWPEFGPSGGPK